jgi:hypothetical protein
MGRVFLSIIAIVFGTGSAFAQSTAYNLTPPPGWTVKEAGNVMLITPGNDPSGGTVLTMIPVLPAGGNFGAVFNAQKAVLENALKLRPITLIAPLREVKAGAELALEGGAYTNGQANYAVAFIGRAEIGILGMGMLISNDTVKGPAYSQQLAAMLTSMRLSSQAPALAATNATALIKQAQQQQAQQKQQQRQQAQQSAAQQAPTPPPQSSGGYHWEPKVGYSGSSGMYIY